VRRRRALLFSGGLDSTIAYRLLGRPHPVYFHIGHFYEEAEVVTIERVSRWFATHDVPLSVEMVTGRLALGDHENVDDKHVALRNLLLGACAALDADTIYLASVTGEAGRDKSRRFLEQAGRLMSFSEDRHIQYLAPFQRMTKTEMVATYLQFYPTQHDAELLRMTRSCYAKGAAADTIVGCGRCMACFRRWVAMSNNGLEETYEQPPWEWSLTRWREWRWWLNYYRRTDRRELPGVVRSNMDAVRAIQRARRNG